MIDQHIIQKEYGFLEADGAVQANVCMMGIPPLRTQEASRRFMEGFLDYSMGVDFERYGRMRAGACGLLAKLINGSPDEIAVTKNTTEGVCALAAGYPLGPGDNVVTCDLENHSNLFPWFNNAKIRGYEVREAKTSRGRITPAEIEALMDGGTKIVSLSAVQAGTGYFADLRAISKICRAKGVIFAVDAIQALGRINIDVKDMGIDYLSCGGFKGLLSALGTGFLWCKGALIDTITPPYIGYQSATPYYAPPSVTPNADGFALNNDMSRFGAGTHNMHGVALMESSVGMLLELGPDNIEKHVLGLERGLRARLADIKTGLDVLTPESEERQSGMIVAYYPKEHADRVSEILKSRRIMLTHRKGYLRMAFGIHNTPRDVDIIADAMEEAGRLSGAPA